MSVSEVDAKKSASVSMEGGECMVVAPAGKPSVPESNSVWTPSVKVNHEGGVQTSRSGDDCSWKASVKVNKEAGSRTSASSDDGIWRASVKVNREAGNRTSVHNIDDTWRASVKVNTEDGGRTAASSDNGTWKTSVKVNKEAGNRTSASTDKGTWRSVVKVNTEAGNRCSDVFNHSFPSDTVSRRTGVRVLNEPGGSGADVYGTLYGNIEETPTIQNNVISGAEQATTEDIEIVVSNSAGYPSGPETQTKPWDSHINENEDVVMQDTYQTDENPAYHDSDLGSEASAEVAEVTETDKPPSAFARLTLPPVHPFFSGAISEEDSDILEHALTQTAFEDDFTSFTSIVNCCVEVPVRLVSEKLEKVTVDWFCNSLRIVEHLRWLRQLMLMSEGLCWDIFARDFLLGLNSTTRVNWGVEGRLSSALTLAMIEGSVASDAISQNFYYSTTSRLSKGKLSAAKFAAITTVSYLLIAASLVVLDSLTMTPAVATLLGEIELVYDVKWPLGLVITPKSLEYYKNIHRFLLHVRLTALEMREVWGLLRTIRQRGVLSPDLGRLCESAVYKVQALFRAFNETFATKVCVHSMLYIFPSVRIERSKRFLQCLQVLMSAWSELEYALQKATMLTELRRCHEDYVNVALRCCFFDTPEINLALEVILVSAGNLARFVRGLDRQVTGRASEEARIHTLCDEYNAAEHSLVASLQNIDRHADRSAREFSETENGDCDWLKPEFNSVATLFVAFCASNAAIIRAIGRGTAEGCNHMRNRTVADCNHMHNWSENVKCCNHTRRRLQLVSNTAIIQTDRHLESSCSYSETDDERGAAARARAAGLPAQAGRCRQRCGGRPLTAGTDALWLCTWRRANTSRSGASATLCSPRQAPRPDDSRRAGRTRLTPACALQDEVTAAKTSTAAATVLNNQKKAHKRASKERRAERRRQQLPKLKRTFTETWLDEVFVQPSGSTREDVPLIDALCFAGIPKELRGRAWAWMLGNTLQVNEDLFNICKARAQAVLMEMSLKRDVEHSVVETPTASSGSTSAILESPGRSVSSVSSASSATETNPEESEGPLTADESAAIQAVVSAKTSAATDTSSTDEATPPKEASDRRRARRSSAVLPVQNMLQDAVSIAEMLVAHGERSIKLVNVDMPRTFGHHPLFQPGAEGTERTTEVLEAYICYRPDLGYVQGMSYLAATLCFHMDSFTAFKALVALMSSSLLFDMFRLEATRTLLTCSVRSAAGLLSLFQDSLLQMEAEDIMRLLHNFPKNTSSRQLFESIESVSLSCEEINELLAGGKLWSPDEARQVEVKFPETDSAQLKDLAFVSVSKPKKSKGKKKAGAAAQSPPGTPVEEPAPANGVSEEETSVVAAPEVPKRSLADMIKAAPQPQKVSQYEA
ncbi:unnamed protein product [Phytophthora fragariaefolia]|uniref:Unnamed protein product n=1 Tax=Phytophthora fragariaefolia TaxID=1490495 RepID=A0A9W6WSC4_9STRA|nr:unnamed protein product [Phytophthora fragariaefolia]